MSSHGLLAISTHTVDSAIFSVADALEVPVLILALLALAAVIVELGRFLVEQATRRRRRVSALDRAAAEASAALDDGDAQRACRAVAPVSWSAAMSETLAIVIAHARAPHGEHRLNKALADFDFDAQRRLGRTRLLVRAGPALGLMGTLIPLSPALTGLADGDVSKLSTNLRIAFSVTVLGLLVGAVAFGLSLARDRMYGQDLSDLQYLAAIVGADEAERS